MELGIRTPEADVRRRKRKYLRTLKAKVRRRRYRRFMSRYGRYVKLTAALIAGLMIIAVAAAVSGASRKQEAEAVRQQPQGRKELEAQRTAEQIAGVMEAQEVQQGEQYPFNTMSRDWGAEDIQGFTPYTIPQEYEKAGGMFPEVMQEYTYILCKQNDVDFAVILAMVEVESSYKWDAVGTGGDVGYMQIVQKWHEDRMESLGAQDLLNPFQNVRIGIDFMAELLEKYGGNYEKALTAYQYGAAGAQENIFSAGQDCSPYAQKVLGIADRIRKQIGGGESDVAGRFD